MKFGFSHAALRGLLASSRARRWQRALGGADEMLAPCRPVTAEPGHHWFGYYDKLQFDPTERYLLGMRTGFERRSPQPGDAIEIGLIDLHNGDQWQQLGESRSWCWQQGCMLQWRPGSEHEVLWNDCVDGQLVCRVCDVRTGQQRILPRPIYHLDPSGQWGLGLDFARLHHMRPGYGYAAVEDPQRDVAAPETSVLYRMNLDTGDAQALFSVADIARIPYRSLDLQDRHYFNHIQWNTDGSRFLFFDLWRTPRGSVHTRVFTADPDGSGLRLLTGKSSISHYTWRDPEHVLIYRHTSYRLYKDDGSGREQVLWTAPNGHQTYLPNADWLLTDTYVAGQDRRQWLYAVHLPSRQMVRLGHFTAAPDYRGEHRCDLHPRLSPSGEKVVIDSTHGGAGRQMYLLDISLLTRR